MTLSSIFKNFKCQACLAFFALFGIFLFSVNNVEAKLINIGTSTDIVYIEGSLGIGTTAPSATLHVASGGIKFPDGSYMTSAGVGSANSLSNITDLIINADSDANGTGALRFQTKGVDKLYINNAGNVGIGTTAPVGYLHVKSITATPAAIFEGGVGIGTTVPAYTLDITGTGNFTQPVIVGTPTASTHATTKNYVDSTIAGGSGSTVGYWAQNGTNINNSNAANVGIGTTFPGAKLSLTAATASTTMAIINTNTAGFAGMEMRLADNSNWGANVSYQQTADYLGLNVRTGAITFLANSVEKMRMNNSGNFGIGTTAPQGILHINSGTTSNNLVFEKSGGSASRRTLGMSIGGVNDSSLMFTSSSDTNPANAFANQVMAINAAGNVGIGTSNPSYKLEVSGTGSFTQPLIVGTPTASTHATTKSYVDSLLGGSGGTVGYWTLNGTNINSVNSGNVGIGLTNPAAKLDVTGNVNILGSADIAGTTLANGYLKLGTTLSLDSNEIYFGANGTIGTIGAYSLIFNTNGANERMRITSAGNVGIGTTAPVGYLHVKSITATPAAVFEGGVGIGTTAPAYTLDITGTGQFTSPVIVGTPTAATHATTKAYVDSIVGGGGWTISGNNIYNGNSGNVGIGTTNPLAKLQVTGGMIFGRTTVADLNYTALATDYIIAYTSISTNRTVTLPTAICNSGRVLTVVDESGNCGATKAIIIDPEGAATIIGQSTFSLVGPYNSVMIYCNGTNWFLN